MGWRKQLLAGAALGVVAFSAQANVVYDWVPGMPGTTTKNTGTVETVGGRIVVTDAAYRSGSLSVDYRPETGYGDPSATESLDQLNRRLRNGPFVRGGLDIQPGGGASLAPGRNDFVDLGLSLTANLIFRDDGYLGGDLFEFDVSDNFRAVGAGTSWSVNDINSDVFLDECNGSSDVPCSGGTGYWQLDRSTLPASVPAPSVWSLFGIGVVGIFGVFARRRSGAAATQATS